MRPPRLILAVLAVAAAVTVTACGSAAPTPVTSSPLWLSKTAVSRPTKVLVVVEENHTQSAALAGMPYLASLAKAHGRTTAYRAITHPSLPNYLAIAGGSTFGIRDDRGPASHPLTATSAFDRVVAAGQTAKTYAEAMPSPCALSSTSRYAVKHNPWAYFAGATSRANCRRFDVPSGTPSSGALRNDIAAGRLPTVGLLVPDICHDGHDCSLTTADNWLKGWLTAIRNGPDYRAGRLAVIVTFDEDDNSGSNTVLTVVVSPYTKGIVSTAGYTHYSLTRYFAEISRTTPVGAAATAPSLRAAFHL